MFAETVTAQGFESIFTYEAIWVVLSLVLIEGLLSVDNALAIAAMASHLDEKKRKTAMWIGYAFAYGFRLVALLIADFIIGNPWLMIIGAAYLIWLMCNHFSEVQEQEDDPALAAKHQGSQHSFGRTIAMIAFLDLSLSFDNVVAAVAFARDNIWFVYIGVTIGIITLRLVAGYCIKLLEKQPWLEHTAFILVGFVGILLCVELVWDMHIRQVVSIPNVPLLQSISIVSSESATTSTGEVIDHYHIQKVVKFGGLLSIILLHLAIEKIPGLKLIFHPVLAILQLLFAWTARIINFLFGVVTYPAFALFRLIRPQPIQSQQAELEPKPPAKH
jgi:YkoY family integral membrane protein